MEEINGLVVVSQSVSQKVNPLNRVGGCNLFVLYNKQLAVQRFGHVGHTAR